MQLFLLVHLVVSPEVLHLAIDLAPPVRVWRELPNAPAHNQTRARGLGEAQVLRARAGALLTADGTEDDLIKLEDVPKGEKFFF